MMALRNSAQRRFMGTVAGAFPKFEGSVRLLPMPHLSPHMVSGKLLKWHSKEGGMIAAYELIADIQPDQLTEILDERPEMEVELQEEMYIAKFLCSEGQDMKSGAPLAILCEMEEDIEQAKQLTVDLEADVYANPEGVPMALWQAYLKKAVAK